MTDAASAREFGDALTNFTSVVFRLETLQTYRAPEEAEMFAAFLAGQSKPPPVPAIEEWTALIRAHGGRRTFQRVHVVQEPLSDYVRFELAWGYSSTVSAGEDVRIIALAPTDPWPWDVPCEDFWLFDDRELYRARYERDGSWAGVDRLHSSEQLHAAQQRREAALRCAVPWADYMREQPELLARAS